MAGTSGVVLWNFLPPLQFAVAFVFSSCLGFADKPCSCLVPVLLGKACKAAKTVEQEQGAHREVILSFLADC